MPLEELEKKLYKPEEPKKPAEPSYRKFRPAGEEPTPEEEKAAREWIEEKKKPPIFTPKQKKISKIVFLVFILLALAGGAAFYFLRQPFIKEQVTFALTGPSEVRAGQKAVFTAYYKNNSPLVLSNAELIFSYPDGVILIGGLAQPEAGKSGAVSYSLGNIGIGGSGQQEFQIRVVGDIDTAKQLEAKLVYRPQNTSARFENKAAANVIVAAYSLVLDVEAPQKILDGEKINYVIRYSNISQESFSNVKVEVAYPENFYFESADPQPTSNNNVWRVDKVEADAGGQIFIKGVIRGSEGESKPLKAAVGIEEDRTFLAFREAKAASQIAASPILIASSVNEMTEYTAFPGDALKYKITYKNNSAVGLKEVVVKARLTGEMFDFSTLRLPTGSFDGRTATITWHAGNVPQFLVLNPGEGGELNFELKLRGDYPIKTFADKNFTVKMSANIETKTTGLFLAQEKISQTSELAAKVAGRLSVRSKGYFNDPTVAISNSGPMPPRVNQTTTYVIHWQVINFSNDSENVLVKTVLPQGVNWTGKIFNLRSETSPEYNERTAEVVWNLGKVQPGIGVILPAQEVAFQVALTPSPPQAGRLVSVFSPTTISGKDAFTGVNLSESAPAIQSDLPDDNTVSYNDGIVQQ